MSEYRAGQKNRGGKNKPSMHVKPLSHLNL